MKDVEMEKFLNQISETPEGKKLLLSIYYACNAYSGNKNIFKEYLNALKNKQEINHLQLKQKPFIYEGQLMNLLTGKTFFEYYSSTKDRLQDSMQGTPFSTEKRNFVYPDHFSSDSLDSRKFNYGKLIGAGSYLWVTPHDTKVNSLKLGIEKKIDEDIIAFCFPESSYKLFYTSAVEGYGKKWDSNNLWYFGNQDENQEWGCTINIDAVKLNCNQTSLRGLPEALIEPMEFTEEFTILYIEKTVTSKTIFDQKYNQWLTLIENDLFEQSIIDNIIEYYKGVHP